MQRQIVTSTQAANAFIGRGGADNHVAFSTLSDNGLDAFLQIRAFFVGTNGKGMLVHSNPPGIRFHRKYDMPNSLSYSTW